VPHHMINKLFHPDPPWSLSFSSFLRYVIWTAPNYPKNLNFLIT